jgi:hypothetical protein
MLAHHPISGKPIRILKTETHLHKNNKTMVWLRSSPEQFAEPARFQRWHTIVNTIQDANSWKECFGMYPSVIVLTKASEEVKSWLMHSAPRSSQLLFLSREVMSIFGLQWFGEQKFINVICLEELSQLYPHIPRSYTPDMSDILTIMMVALVIRVRRLCGVSKTEMEQWDVKSCITEIKNQFAFDIEELREPPPLWLIQQYFEPEKAKRAREYKKCLEKNLACPFIDKFILLNEQDFSSKLPKHAKLQQEILGHRMKYSDVIHFIKDSVPENTIVVFANLDIYLDSSWKDVWSLNLENTFLSLLRYDEGIDDKEPQLFGPRPDSQDTWVVFSSSVKSREWDWSPLEFEFGKSGCDNAINVEMLKKKFIVANPALSLKTIHCHQSQFRTYSPEDVVDKPIFMYLDPTGLHDLQVISNMKQYESRSTKPVSFARRIRATDEKTLNTFCKMVGRDERFLFSPTSDNLYIQKGESIYSLKNSFVTTNGLVYDYDKLFMGSSDFMREIWSKTIISNMTASIGVQSILAAHLEDNVANDLWQYMTKYLPKLFRLNSMGYKGDMWLSRESKKIQDFLQFFKWEDDVMPVLPRDKEIVGFGKSVTYMEPQATSLILKEDVDALRARLKNYERAVKHPKRVVILQDDDILSSDDVLALENSLELCGYEVNVVYPSRSSPSFIFQRISGVEYCISCPGQEALFWLLPKSCKIIDVMSELNICGEGAHFAGACEAEYWVNLIPKLKTELRRKCIVEKVLANMKHIETAPKSSINMARKQIITLPAGQTGFHGHSGDSFREMVGIWAERGFVEVQESKDTPYVWWGNPGDILLYDRANFDWIRKTPCKYTKILCGNPDATQIEDGIQWSFWPRRPRLLESQVALGILPWTDRTKTLVFYGRVENSVQQEHRSNELSKACDEFDMPIGANQPYTYSQKEYLDRLSKSKFGLCLAGFGPKCNREIECMALGTVPVVAPDVDMQHYSNPPQEGIHYIRLKSFDPEEAKTAIQAISKEKWEEMSRATHSWWKENCSVEGLFEVTKALTS